MDKNRKDLKSYSILILVLVALTLIRSIVNFCTNGLPQAEGLPAGSGKELVQISTIIGLVVGILLLIPQVYVGVKGIKVANNKPSINAPIE